MQILPFLASQQQRPCQPSAPLQIPLISLLHYVSPLTQTTYRSKTPLVVLPLAPSHVRLPQGRVDAGSTYILRCERLSPRTECTPEEEMRLQESPNSRRNTSDRPNPLLPETPASGTHLLQSSLLYPQPRLRRGPPHSRSFQLHSQISCIDSQHLQRRTTSVVCRCYEPTTSVSASS